LIFTLSKHKSSGVDLRERRIPPEQEDTMLRYAGVCGPEELETLQKVFDLIWMELRANGSKNYTGPANPDALREEIARRVFDLYKASEATSDDLASAVLTSFGVPMNLTSLPPKPRLNGPRARPG
jgi:hypothetical protein